MSQTFYVSDLRPTLQEFLHNSMFSITRWFLWQPIFCPWAPPSPGASTLGPGHLLSFYIFIPLSSNTWFKTHTQWLSLSHTSQLQQDTCYATPSWSFQPSFVILSSSIWPNPGWRLLWAKKKGNVDHFSQEGLHGGTSSPLEAKRPSDSTQGVSPTSKNKVKDIAYPQRPARRWPHGI